MSKTQVQVHVGETIEDVGRRFTAPAEPRLDVLASSARLWPAHRSWQHPACRRKRTQRAIMTDLTYRRAAEATKMGQIRY